MSKVEGSQNMPQAPQQPAQQPYQQPYYQQPYQPAPPQKAPPPLPATFQWLALVGIIVLVVGLIIGSANVFVDDQKTATNMWAIGNIIGEIGGLMLVIGLIVPAFSLKEIDPMVRTGLFIAVALIVGLLVLAL